MLFLKSWRVRVVPYYVTTHPPAIRKQYRHSGEAQIEPTLFECDCEQGRREGGGAGGGGQNTRGPECSVGPGNLGKMFVSFLIAL
jgi:hypothetical protein